LVGALVGIQVAPESTDVNMPPLTATATNLVPSAEDAIEFHCLLGAPRKVQVRPAFVEVRIPDVAQAANLKPSAEDVADVQETFPGTPPAKAQLVPEFVVV
jgi:hypothetical protein